MSFVMFTSILKTLVVFTIILTYIIKYGDSFRIRKSLCSAQSLSQLGFKPSELCSQEKYVLSSHRNSKSYMISTGIASDLSDEKLSFNTDIADLLAIRRDDFPILSTKVYQNKPLIYLDSAASSQKPSRVIDAISDYYKTTHSNVHRGAHALANRATTRYEWARDQVQEFINAKHREEIVFTKGATDAINLVAMSYAATKLAPGDEIILSVMEHHSNLVPWQLVAQRTGAILKFINLTSNGIVLDLEHYHSLLSDRTKIVAVSHVSNVLGYVNPVKQIIESAHKYGAVVLLDACQSVPNIPVDVQDLDVDFIVASSHKMCGPTGIGFLYGKIDILRTMPPVSGGGEMVDRVGLYSSTYALPPSRFESGTPAISEAIGLGVACEYLREIGMSKIRDHEVRLGAYLYEQLRLIDGLVLYGPPVEGSSLASYPIIRTGLVAFNHKTIHPTDLSFFLDQEGVAVRTGQHCTQPLHTALGVVGTIRASLYFYNDKNDVDTFIDKLKSSIDLLSNF